MPIIKAPVGTSSVTTYTGHAFEVDSAGLIDTEQAPAAAVNALYALPGFRDATEEEIAAIDTKAMQEQMQQDVQGTKASLKAALTNLGVSFDGRASMMQLQRLYQETTRSREAALIAEEKDLEATRQRDIETAAAAAAQTVANAAAAAAGTQAPPAAPEAGAGQETTAGAAGAA